MKKSLEKCYINFSGGGNREGKYWIIGFEPGGRPDEQKMITEHEIIEYINDYKKIVVEGTVYKDLANIIRLIDPTYIKNENNTEIIDLDENGKFYYTNLFPLNFKNENDDFCINQYRNVFCDFLPSLDRRRIYNSDWISKRYKKQFKSWLSTPKVIIILKKNFNAEYKNLLGLEESWNTKYNHVISHGNTSYYIYNNFHQIFLLKNGRIGFYKMREVLITGKII